MNMLETYYFNSKIGKRENNKVYLTTDLIDENGVAYCTADAMFIITLKSNM